MLDSLLLAKQAHQARDYLDELGSGHQDMGLRVGGGRRADLGLRDVDADVCVVAEVGSSVTRHRSSLRVRTNNRTEEGAWALQ